MPQGQIVFALACLLPVALAAQTVPGLTPSVTTPKVMVLDDEPHHHLVLKNDLVKMFEVDLAPRDAFPMHRHDYDEVFVVISDANTVSTTPGKADILRMSKNGQVRLIRGGRMHSVRNIGETSYRAVLIELLQSQTGARNLCGNQIPGMKPDCPAVAAEDAKGPRVNPAVNPPDDVPQNAPQFETDQTRVALTSIRPHQQASFGDAERDELIVAIDETLVAFSGGKEPDQTLAAGGPLWIARGNAKRILKNNSEKEEHIVTVEFKP